MGYAAQNLRDLLALARMLRDFARRHPRDKNYGLFLSSAAALEAHAHLIAAAAQGGDLKRNAALHAPVNVLI
jgi:hypothetical protein